MSNIVNKGNEIRKTKKLYGGESRDFSVYKVDIEELYYNDENGRIATFMAEYDSTHADKISTLSRKDYNDTIMKFIKDSESSATFEKTKENIRSIGQMEVGVILEDGRVIDGNRRFTCLRDLYAETEDLKYRFFECIILPVPTTDLERHSLKSLELAAQYGTDEKVGYSPIDRLADIYRDLVAPNHYFTEKEYLQRVNQMITANDLKLMINKAKTLHDYLDFINKPERWDVARVEKLDGPIQEIANLRKKIGETDEWDRVKNVLFTQMQDMSGDRTREMRKLISLYKKDPASFEKIASEVEDLVLIKTEAQLSSSNENNVSFDDEVEKKKSSINKSIQTNFHSVQVNEAKAKQLKMLEDVYEKLGSIDTFALQHSDDDMKKKIVDEIDKINGMLIKLKDMIN